MDIALAGPESPRDFARLLWLHASTDEQDRQNVDSFAARRQVTAFLRGHARLPEAVDRALTTATGS